MTFLKRLRVLPAVLGVAAAIAAVGTNLFGDIRSDTRQPAPRGERPDGGAVVEELAATKFSKLPALTYQPRDGETLFAWQIRPTLDPVPARPRDVLVLVDTSASQAGKPLKQARQIITALTSTLTPADRISVWSVSTPATTRALTRDFQPADADEVRHAAAALTEVEYGSGATDLKGAIRKALATLAPNRGRQQVVLYLGDGESTFEPLSETDRVALGAEMDARDVFFFAVPLGIKVNAQNIHGLATITGGAVVRLQEDLTNTTRRGEFLARLKAALDTPVLKVDQFKFGDEVGEAYPTKLPPLRADRSTLVMGKLAKPGATAVTLTATGSVAGRANTQSFNQVLPAPQYDHFFLNLMLEQWRGAPHKDAPAMLQSDRALALASTQVKLYRDEFLVQAIWAVRMDRWEDATKLYKAAQQIDPNDPEAAAGLALIEKLKTGKVTKADLEQRIAAKADALKVAPDQIARTVVQHVAAQPPAATQPPGTTAPPAAADVLKEAAARRQIEEQRYRVLTDATIKRARQLLRTDPDGAYQDLKRQRDEIALYEGIGNAARTQMIADLEAVMREIFLKGAEIKRQAAEERAAIAKTRQRLNEFDRSLDETARTKSRIDMFRQLMQRARFELAYQEAQLMIQENISSGRPVPITATASYIIGQQATQLREWRELVRIREDRFLLAMMQTEKSHIPYPDEPPVHFPPAAVWRELTSLRREAYLNSNLGPDPPQSQIDLKNKVENQEVTLREGQNLNDMPLYELLQYLSKTYNVSFVIMEDYFKAEGVSDIRDRKPNIAATQLRGLKLGTFLDIVLLNMGATFIVRPNYIEITTFNRRLEEKVTRVFPVADLVIPIPNAVNQATLFQNLFFQNQQLAIFGQVLGQGTFQGFGGAFGGQQGGQFGGGLPGGGPFGQGGQPGGGGFGPPEGGNLGAGAGGLQVGGGNLGQFGNLGGQFGLQGGDQSLLLMNLIVDTVARGEWTNVRPPGGMPMMNNEEELPELPRKQLNSLGYYPPARALIIRGTSRYHPATTIKLAKPEGGLAAAPNNQGGGAIVINPDGGNNPRPKDPVAANPPKNPGNKPKDPDGAVASAEPGHKPTLIDPKLDPAVLKPKLSSDPRRRWSEAIDWTVTDPGLIVASAEFLMEMDEHSSAAEILKGSLRKGLTTDSWAHEALAIALQDSGASQAEIERAALSVIDLDPTDPKAYLKAARLEADLKNHDQAIAFCKRAAKYAPEEPNAYANALAYAEHATDLRSDAVIWAAQNLLRRDWNIADGIDYHKQVNERLPKLAAKLAAAGVKTDDIRRTLAEQTQRDLTIQLLWNGSADLDLVVTEPGGSVCSATHKRTTGGGVLQSDVLDQTDERDRSEVYTAALAFNGTYRVSVRKVLGRPTGDKATLKVTKFQGTPKESHDLITIDLANPSSIEIKLEGGSRTELATVLEDDDTRLRAATTGANLTSGPSGLGGGFGSLANGPTATTGPNLPVVNPATEVRLPGIGIAADLRASVKVNPDRQSMSFHVNPVFGTGKAVTMPKVPLLPGSDGP